VLRIGAMPVSRPLNEYLAMHPEAEHWLVTEAGDWPDPVHRTRRVIHASPAALCRALAAAVETPVPTAWTSTFLAQEARVSDWLEERAAELPLEWRVLRALPAPLRDGTWIFCANSLVIRDVDAVLAGGGQRLRLTGQRGVSGIDGHLSTAGGLAAAGGAGVVALVGDLATFHDLTGLGLLAQRDVTVVVFNNGGGGIFDLLPQAELPEFERLWRTPRPWSLRRAAHLFGLPYRRVEDAEDFGRTLLAARRKPGPAMIEVRVDPARGVEARKACWKWAEGLQ
jgi:2-succinyl-5-enolpyruvyl-6-hydroxy-3-cyclohexene-1-carboxylate synthase